MKTQIAAVDGKLVELYETKPVAPPKYKKGHKRIGLYQVVMFILIVAGLAVTGINLFSI